MNLNSEAEDSKEQVKSSGFDAKLVDSFVVKKEVLSGVCFCCLSDESLKDIVQPYPYDGRTEIYSEMITYCYSIQIIQELGGAGGDQQYLLCESCVEQLRAASTFRRQIETATINFKSLLEGKNQSTPEFMNFEYATSDDYSDGDSPIAELLTKEHKARKRKTKKAAPKSNKKPDREKVKFKSDIKYEDDDELLERPKRRLILETSSKISKISKDLIKSEDEDYPEENEKPKKKNTLKSKTRKIKFVKSKLEVESEKKESRQKWKDEELPYKLEKTDLECKICGMVFVMHKSLQVHMPSHFPNHICEHCGRGFAARRQLLAHVGIHSDARYMCAQCPGRTFKSRGAMRQHERAHRGQKEVYRCPMCEERFISYNARRQHMLDQHGVEKNKYPCKHCEATFSTATSASAHVRRVHLQERKHSCNVCAKTFYSRLSVKQHMLTHTGERNYPCSICGKEYLRKYTLKEHQKIHSGDKSHVCNVCGRAFTQRSTLKGHMQVHIKNSQAPLKVDS